MDLEREGAATGAPGEEKLGEKGKAKEEAATAEVLKMGTSCGCGLGHQPGARGACGCGMWAFGLLFGL